MTSTRTPSSKKKTSARGTGPAGPTCPSYPAPTHDTALNAAQRKHALEEMSSSEGLDLLVVGGGVTGAGIALDAAARGLRTGIVEMGDWASGIQAAGPTTEPTGFPIIGTSILVLSMILVVLSVLVAVNRRRMAAYQRRRVTA